MLNNLSVIFCVGIAASMAKRKRAEAAILSLISFLIFLAANNAWLSMNGLLAEEGVMGYFGTGQGIVLGFQVVDMNVLLGMIIGCLTGYIHNKFSDKEFIEMFRIYGGSRFSFIIMIPLTLLLAVVLCYVWPVINSGISAMSGFILNAGLLGIFIYAFLNKFLIPTGLHHLLWMPFCFTAIGGTAEIGGQVYSGAVNIFDAEMSNAAALGAMDDSLRFATFGFVKIFGSLGVVLAILRMSRPENRKIASGMLVPALFVSMFAGITEPIDFAFLFCSPVLWLVHGVLAGISEVILWALGSRTYMLYGLIDTIVSNSVIPPALSKFYLVIIVGVVMTAVWYFVFVFLIKRLNIMTPGRAANYADEADATAMGDFLAPANITAIIQGLGGAGNIETVGNCMTRLRCEVKDAGLIDKSVLEGTEQKGVVFQDNNVQIIIGLKVNELKEAVCSELKIE